LSSGRDDSGVICRTGEVSDHLQFPIREVVLRQDGETGVCAAQDARRFFGRHGVTITGRGELSKVRLALQTRRAGS